MTAIEWTDETWNPMRGCTRKSAGCEHCYAEGEAMRVNRCSTAQGRPAPYDGLIKLVQRGDRTEARWTGKVRFAPEMIDKPLRWRAPRRVFVNSMSDLFHDGFTDWQIAAVFGVMAVTPRHTFQVLTKRPERMRAWFAWLDEQAATYNREWDRRAYLCWRNACRALDAFDGSAPFSDFLGITHTVPWPLPNVWLGVSVEDQAAADERIPDLLATPAAVRWLSCEPLLGPLDLNAKCPPFYAPHLRSDRISWVVAGCESGPGARPAEVDWFRSLRDQCAAAGVPIFIKQAMGPGITAGPGSHRKAAGLIGAPYLDGAPHLEFPR